MAKIHGVSVPNADIKWTDEYLQHKKSKGINESQVWMTGLRRLAESEGDDWQQEKIRHDEQETGLITAATLLDQKEQEEEMKKEQQGHRSHIPVRISLLSADEQMDYFLNLGRSCPDCLQEYHRLKDKVDQEEMRKEAQQLKQEQLKQEQKQLLEQEPEEKEDEEIEEEIIEVPTTITTTTT